MQSPMRTAVMQASARGNLEAREEDVRLLGLSPSQLLGVGAVPEASREAQIELLRERVESLNREQTALRRDQQEQARIEATRADLLFAVDVRLKALGQDGESLREQIAGLRGDLEGEVAGCRDDVSALRRHIRSQGTDLAANAEDLERSLRRDLERIEQRHSQLGESITSQDRQRESGHTDLRTLIGASAQDLADLQVNFNKLKSSFEMHQAYATERMDQIERNVMRELQGAIVSEKGARESEIGELKELARQGRQDRDIQERQHAELQGIISAERQARQLSDRSVQEDRAARDKQLAELQASLEKRIAEESSLHQAARLELKQQAEHSLAGESSVLREHYTSIRERIGCLEQAIREVVTGETAVWQKLKTTIEDSIQQHLANEKAAHEKQHIGLKDALERRLVDERLSFQANRKVLLDRMGDLEHELESTHTGLEEASLCSRSQHLTLQERVTAIEKVHNAMMVNNTEAFQATNGHLEQQEKRTSNLEQVCCKHAEDLKAAQALLARMQSRDPLLEVHDRTLRDVEATCTTLTNHASAFSAQSAILKERLAVLEKGHTQSIERHASSSGSVEQLRDRYSDDIRTLNAKLAHSNDMMNAQVEILQKKLGESADKYGRSLEVVRSKLEGIDSRILSCETSHIEAAGVQSSQGVLERRVGCLEEALRVLKERHAEELRAHAKGLDAAMNAKCHSAMADRFSELEGALGTILCTGGSTAGSYSDHLLGPAAARRASRPP